MLMKETILSLLLVVFLATGCVVKQGAVSLLTSEAIKEVADFDLCLSYHVAMKYRLSTRNIVPEINRRGLLTEEDWGYVRWKNISPGMSVCALYAAWGKPKSVGPIVHFDRQDRTRTLHIYQETRGTREIQVYTEEGKVIDYID